MQQCIKSLFYIYIYIYIYIILFHIYIYIYIHTYIYIYEIKFWYTVASCWIFYVNLPRNFNPFLTKVADNKPLCTVSDWNSTGILFVIHYTHTNAHCSQTTSYTLLTFCSTHQIWISDGGSEETEPGVCLSQ